MKKLLLLAVVSFIAFVAEAQQTPAADSAVKKDQPVAKLKKAQNPAGWACPKCFVITKEAGACTADQTEKVQLGTYYCNHCMKTTGNKPGKCTACSADAVQMTRKLCAKNQAAPVKKAA